MEKEKILKIKNDILSLTPDKIINYLYNEYGNKVSFATSLGAEDQVITEMIATNAPKLKTFTLDTGRLFPETYDLLDRTVKKYKLPIELMFPDSGDVENMVNEKGINLFFESIDNRKQCCHIRKVKPMKRALKGYEVWISGLRKEQALSRTDIDIVEYDENYGLIKVNPIYNWTEKQVWDYINAKNIPYNPLHNKGFPSIGCQPCTRAIFPGEDIRAGRWWWENPYTRECGLHTKS